MGKRIVMISKWISLTFTINQKISEIIKTLFTIMLTKLKAEVYYEN